MIWDDTARAHTQDSRDQHVMDSLRHLVEDFLYAPPNRCSDATLDCLKIAVDMLKRDSEHITKVWD